MKERPILFSAPMVRAILDGRKTVTRRVLRPQPPGSTTDVMTWNHPDDERKGAHFWSWGPDPANPGRDYIQPDWAVPCRYGEPGDRLAGCGAVVNSGHRIGGDRLYVRETWAAPHAYDHLPPRLIPQDARIHYAATEDRGGLLWRPSIHMPRWASRITLEVTGVRVERLQDISEADAKAEGALFELAEIDSVRLGAMASHRGGFRNLWTSINGPDSWNANPWVWVIEFKRIKS